MQNQDRKLDVDGTYNGCFLGDHAQHLGSLSQNFISCLHFLALDLVEDMAAKEWFECFFSVLK
jgi:hypothetical protein